MKREERRQRIMDLLVSDGEVQLDALAVSFGVSRMTVHRDMDDLEAAGLLRKIRGGATIRPGTHFESDFRFREHRDAASKSAMAKASLALIEPGMTVMINDGSMAAVLGRMTPRKRPLTIITNNVAILDALRSVSGIMLIAVGGVYSQKFNAYLGKVAEDSLSQLRADMAFISTPAVAGLEVFHMDDRVVRCKRAMMRQADICCLTINHSRFGQAALYRLAALSEFRHIITDGAPSEEIRSACYRAGIQLKIVSPAEGET